MLLKAYEIFCDCPPTDGGDEPEPEPTEPVEPTWTEEANLFVGRKGLVIECRPPFLYQDAEGTVPVTADGDPVGLILDSKHLPSNYRGIVNLLTDTENLYGSISRNDMTALIKPDGEVGEVAILDTTQLGVPQEYNIRPGVSTTAGEAVTFSVYLKAGSLEYVQLYAYTTCFNGEYANFNLRDGTIEVNSSANAIITDAGYGWYRCSISVTTTSTVEDPSVSFKIFPINSATVSAATGWVGSDHYYFFGANAQYEKASAPSEYQAHSDSFLPPGFHFTQSDDTLKPVYRTDGTYHWVESDGTATMTVPNNSDLEFSFLHNGTGAFVGLSGKFLSAPTSFDAGIILTTTAYNTSGIGYFVSWESDDFGLRAVVNNDGGNVRDIHSSTFEGEFPANGPGYLHSYYQSDRDPYVFRLWSQNETVYSWSAYSSEANPPSASAATYDLTLFTSGTGGVGVAMELYGLVILDTAPETELAAIGSKLCELGGITYDAENDVL